MGENDYNSFYFLVKKFFDEIVVLDKQIFFILDVDYLLFFSKKVEFDCVLLEEIVLKLVK